MEASIQTSRLTLEPLVPSHAPVLFSDLRDERLYRYHAGRPSSVKQLEERFTSWLARTSPDGLQMWLNYALCRSDGHYVGWVQATVTKRNATIGYDIFPRFWRQGYATEACCALIHHLIAEHDVNHVDAIVDADNVASIGLLESLGFTLAWTGPSEDMPGHVDRRYELSGERFVEKPKRGEQHGERKQP